MNEIEFVVGKRYKWGPYYHSTNLWKNGLLEKIEYKNGCKIGCFVTREDEHWVIPLDGTVNIEKYKK